MSRSKFSGKVGYHNLVAFEALEYACWIFLQISPSHFDYKVKDVEEKLRGDVEKNLYFKYTFSFSTYNLPHKVGSYEVTLWMTQVPGAQISSVRKIKIAVDTKELWEWEDPDKQRGSFGNFMRGIQRETMLPLIHLLPQVDRLVHNHSQELVLANVDPRGVVIKKFGEDRIVAQVHHYNWYDYVIAKVVLRGRLGYYWAENITLYERVVGQENIPHEYSWKDDLWPVEHKETTLIGKVN